VIRTLFPSGAIVLSINETNRMHSVLFGMQNRMLDPIWHSEYDAWSLLCILIPITTGFMLH
jgi:hypothetical protein